MIFKDSIKDLEPLVLSLLFLQAEAKTAPSFLCWVSVESGLTVNILPVVDTLIDLVSEKQSNSDRTDELIVALRVTEAKVDYKKCIHGSSSKRYCLNLYVAVNFELCFYKVILGEIF